MAKGKFTEKTRELIQERADYRCEICGIRMAYGGQIHHRQPRGMGGSRNKEIASPANGIYVHMNCHAMVESIRSRAYTMGWLVHRGRSIGSQEVRLWDGWFLLTDDGLRLPYSPDG